MNDYYDNNFSNVITPYAFTDDNNTTGFGTSAYNKPPLGFKVHSIDPTSDWLHYEKITTGNSSLTDWRKVKKYL